MLDIIPSIALGIRLLEQARQLVALSALPLSGRARCPAYVRGIEAGRGVQVRGERLLNDAASAIEPGELCGQSVPVQRPNIGSCSESIAPALADLTFFEARPKPQTGALQRTILHATVQLLNTSRGICERVRDIAV